MTTEKPPIYMVSGGTGSSGEQLVNTVLTQFPENRVEVVLVSPVRQMEEIEKVVAQAATTGGTIIHAFRLWGLGTKYWGRHIRMWVQPILPICELLEFLLDEQHV